MKNDASIHATQTDDPCGNTLYDDDSLYEFVIKLSDLMQQPQIYGSGVSLSMLERHLLKVIAKNPGITASRIAESWNRTRGAISQQVRKLERNGYIKKIKHIFNEKTDQLYTTQLGEEINNAHLRNDASAAKLKSQSLLSVCTAEEVAAFHKVIHEFTKLLDEDFRQLPQGTRKARDCPARSAEDCVSEKLLEP
jgi:DNA-binding MarR family transcriptional regulator